ncbi:unnamed protein product, partial [Prorocentrum cordatum]
GEQQQAKSGAEIAEIGQQAAKIQDAFDARKVQLAAKSIETSMLQAECKRTEAIGYRKDTIEGLHSWVAARAWKMLATKQGDE